MFPLSFVFMHNGSWYREYMWQVASVSELVHATGSVPIIDTVQSRSSGRGLLSCSRFAVSQHKECISSSVRELYWFFQLRSVLKTLLKKLNA